MRRCIYVILILSAMSFSEMVTQTDWSGASGVYGPVTDWGSDYYSSSNVSSLGGTLKLPTMILDPPAEHTVDDAFTNAYSVYATDIDGDGDTDVLGAASQDNTIAWWENTDGIGTAWTKHTVDSTIYPYWVSVYATDVDGDGDTDVLAAADDINTIAWYENTDGTGTSWTKHTVDSWFPDAYGVYATDVDGDDDTDILGAAFGNDTINWWENTDGVGTSWTEHTVDSTFARAQSVYATDVDGDGDTDVLGAAYGFAPGSRNGGTPSLVQHTGVDVDVDVLGGGGEFGPNGGIAWWENTDGTGTSWAAHPIDTTYTGASIVFATDVDGDGDTDVLGALWLAGDITWWENTDGTGNAWTEHTIDGDFNGAVSVHATDVDGDGDTDVLGAAYSDNTISWWENTDGSGTAWTEHTVFSDFAGAVWVYATDIDGDGTIDVLGAAENVNVIAWWQIIGYAGTGHLESSVLDAGAVSSWDSFLSSSQQPTVTSIGFQFRSSEDSGNMGAWSDTVFTSATLLTGILADSTRYLQYRAILISADSSRTPTLEDVNFTYTLPVGIGEGSAAGISLNPSRNPCVGLLSVQICLPEPKLVELQVFDITGRMVAEVREEFQEGLNTVNFSELASGIYVCIMRSGDFIASERIVLIR